MFMTHLMTAAKLMEMILTLVRDHSNARDDGNISNLNAACQINTNGIKDIMKMN